MKKGTSILSVVLVCILSIVGLADAATHHSGHITSDETWTLVGSPHIVDALLVVRDGATLTIEPGVEVRFNKDAINPKLIIGSDGTPGRLIARGTDTQKIIFTSNEISPQPGDWSDIYFSDTAADDSIIENAIIEYGRGGGAHGNIQIHSSNPTIRNCIIRKGLNDGIYMHDSTSEISGCRFEENEKYGIKISSSSPILDANEFINNGSYPVYINNGSPGYPEPVLYGTNTFSGNNPDQIYFKVCAISHNHTLRYLGIPYYFPSLTSVKDGATLTIEPGVEVRFNKDALNPRLVIGEGGAGGTSGRLIAQGTDTQKIVFTSNAVSPQPGDWNEINFNSTAADDSIIENAIIEYGGREGSIDISNSNPTIRNCIIRRSLNAGIHISGSSSPEISCCDITENEFGIDSSASSGTPNITYNNIFGNLSYGINNRSGSITLNAINNWWGDASGPGGVGPGKGDAVSDGVDYDPWLDHKSICEPLPDIKANGSDGPITISTSDTLSITIELDPGIYPGVPADWWCLADAPFGWYYYNAIIKEWLPRFYVSYQGPLFTLTPPLEVLSMSGLPTGSYSFYFGVDGSSNGNLDGPLYYDSVEVNITPP
jgi:parallel beta-helix repeat protein